ncbi:MAG: hypothetical protein ABI210_00530 [Abditibacteriaceae bacterium]
MERRRPACRHSRERGNPRFAGTLKVLSKPFAHWIPAFAGMTSSKIKVLFRDTLNRK